MDPRRLTRRLLLGLALTATLGSALASAYVFYFTKGGEPLRWKKDATTVRRSTVEPAELSQVEVEQAMDEAFAAWAATGCVPTVTRNGTTDATAGSLPASVRGPADNVVVFIRDAARWSELGHGVLEIAITNIAHNPETGEIVDADIELNDAGFDFSVAATPGPGQVDVRSTLVHEVGHFYGLDHSPERAATMFASYDAVSPTEKRSLHVDDIDGVCALYAIPFPAPDDDGCAATAGTGWTHTLVVLICSCSARVALRRRRHETAACPPA